jgi:phytoene dehydrogenase-like protein
MLRLVGEHELEPEFARKVKRYKSDAIVMFTPHLALNEPPRYVAQNDDVNECLAVGWGVESTEDLESQFEDARARRFPSRPGGMSFSPTVLDPSQAPAGKHTAFVWQLTSYHLPWDEQKREFGDELLGVWREYAPNLTDDNILARFDYSPRDIERSNPSMVEGGAVHGDITPDQMGPFRPIPGYNYRMPIEGLYLCGSSTGNGGGVNGAPGYIAANAIVDDLRLDRPWTRVPPPEWKH